MLNLPSLIWKKMEFSYQAVGTPLAKLQIFNFQLHWQGRFDFYLLQLLLFFPFIFIGHLKNSIVDGYLLPASQTQYAKRKGFSLLLNFLLDILK